MAPDDQCTARDDHQQLECIRHWIALWAQCSVLGKMTKANVDSRQSHIALHCIPLHHTLHLTTCTKLDYIALNCGESERLTSVAICANWTSACGGLWCLATTVLAALVTSLPSCVKSSPPSSSSVSWLLLMLSNYLESISFNRPTHNSPVNYLTVIEGQAHWSDVVSKKRKALFSSFFVDWMTGSSK